jgi:hypothetical protein
MAREANRYIETSIVESSLGQRSCAVPRFRKAPV